MLNLNIAYPPTPTRFGYNSANTIDIALIKNFYYPFTINSIDDLSSDHNPVFLNFSFKLAIEPLTPERSPPTGRNSHLSIENKVLLYTAVMRPILAYASPVWGYAAKTNINKLDTLQNSLIRMIVKATRYMRNDDIRKDLKINSFKAYIQNNAINFFTNLDFINNVNIQNLIPYTPNDNTKRPRRILLDSYNPP
ncbi:uncharacterized protein TNCV_839211 [Trichonephila clavipes]|nr:uncharacterized protein TNCV_839211 [Trichonephila clavipes]